MSAESTVSMNRRRRLPQALAFPAGTLAMPTPHRAREDALHSILSDGFPYSRRLKAHTSCVNALSFSSGDGRFLASGGDDLRIQLWDFYQDQVDAPSFSFFGPRGNIFTLAFSATNRYLYSGGTDRSVFKYDVGAHFGGAPLDDGGGSTSYVYRDHLDSIRSLSCHPVQDEIFLSASEDGCVVFHDQREKSTRAQNTLQLSAEVTGVQYHPLMAHVFATSEGSGRVCLRDARMAFGPLVKRTRFGVVQTYRTKVTRGSTRQLSFPEPSSITFDREGSKMAVTLLHYLPAIYALSDPIPVAICSGKNLPDGTPVPATERTYSNSCTMKHGCFGGPSADDDEFYSAGSDDFRGYVWKIPRLSELAAQRREVSEDEWAAQEWPNTVAFVEDLAGPRHIPVELSTPFCRLTGHDSIVNTTVMHPHLLHIATSGIEKHIVLHSPTPSSPCAQGLLRTPTDVRALSAEAEEDIVFVDSEDEEASERSTIRMFDHILREEGNADVFALRRWAGGLDSDSSDSDDGTDWGADR